MAQTYSIEFKEEACKRVQSGVPAAQMARELGINAKYPLFLDIRQTPLSAVAISIRKTPDCAP